MLDILNIQLAALVGIIDYWYFNISEIFKKYQTYSTSKCPSCGNLSKQELMFIYSVYMDKKCSNLLKLANSCVVPGNFRMETFYFYSENYMKSGLYLLEIFQSCLSILFCLLAVFVFFSFSLMIFMKK